MVIQQKLQTIRDYFGCIQPEHFCDIEPRQILALDGIGPVTLDHLRIYLAARGLALKNDRTAEYWQENLSAAKIGDQLGDLEDGDDKSLITPFTVIIDTAESHPFAFNGIPADARDDDRPWIVQTRWLALGRHPDSLGDYSLDGYIGRCHVERKSLEDCQGTILGFGGRRERFECELANLSDLEAAAVIVEASYLDVVKSAPATPNKTAQQNAKTIMRSIIAYAQDYRVPFIFCDGRRFAELTTFRFLERYWRKRQEEAKRMEKLVGAM